mmetsp:Transcript_12903/g.19352  ORF Transcript_12903/g.19352 Transcript_12903/m.19352 type:complete len:452 (-) Transcript_12903:88-1443(-)|eukprot:CAMPEP_0194111160 /NCGR_PEP_ID=MMETSP0150-20130528/10224_1 /TAXON_ID=122233 /ORGANISM="Chaetoceros debilis, Strain MM31A-1" /LENGTH=451 /DNA_ID=CAMNT_0038800519 /DNA_START=103 /DNA_END=1458 /DNA_ORIENTATION=+
MDTETETETDTATPTPTPTATRFSVLPLPLPDEMLAHILVYVDVVEILQIASHISRQFFDILRCDSFWRVKFIESMDTRSTITSTITSSSTRTRAGITFHPLVMACLTTNKHIQQAFIVSRQRKTLDEKTWFSGMESRRSQASKSNGNGNVNGNVKRESSSSNSRASTSTRTSDDYQYKYIWPRSVLPARGKAIEAWKVGTRRYCLSSSRDRNGYDEVIENVLVDEEFEPVEDDWRIIIMDHHDHQSDTRNRDGTRNRNRNRQHNVMAIAPERQRWWSSAPNVKRSPEDTNEILLFTTNTKAIITEVAIKPLKEPALFNFLGDDHRTVFSWPRISIQVFCLHDNANDNDNDDDAHQTPYMIDPGDMSLSKDRRLRQRPIIEAFLNDHTPVYESPVMDAASNDESWQYFAIPDGVVGNVITFVLWGKHNEQFEQGGYYACVERVAVRGVPLM